MYQMVSTECHMVVCVSEYSTLIAVQVNKDSYNVKSNPFNSKYSKRAKSDA